MKYLIAIAILMIAISQYPNFKKGAVELYEDITD